MNEYGKNRCNELQAKKRSSTELQELVTKNKILSLLCHCSAEIDRGTLLFFSVHNIFMGEGDYVLLLFSDTSDPTEDQDSGMDVYSRMYLYQLIEEEMLEEFFGHMTLHSCELDGRLVVLLMFQYGLMPAHREGLIAQIGISCRNVARACREKYDLQVVTYISDVISQISSIASTYHYMLNVATLHRYTHRNLEDSIYRLIRPSIDDPSPIQFSVEEKAVAIATAIVEQGEYHSLLTDTLNTMATLPLQSNDELKRLFGQLFEELCRGLQQRGVRINVNQLRREQMSLIVGDTDWSNPVNWLVQTVENIAASCATDTQAMLKHNLAGAKEYIHAHLEDPTLSVSGVAEALQISTTALSLIFRHQMNTTPAHYIRRLRLERAGELLRTTKMSVQEISSLCGFGTIETFHRVFKEAYGMTPARLRRMAISSGRLCRSSQ